MVGDQVPTGRIMTVAFDDKSAPPDDAALAKVQGKSNTA